uniref:Uncharacterized protein n=1 Tax=viral metagenome TaxID=1070528 RepID=A0A6M3L442_9ZZZZ
MNNPCIDCPSKEEDTYGLLCDLSCGKHTAYVNYQAGMNELYHQPFTVGGTIIETQDIVISPTVRWREAKIKGDFSCPDCGQVMIVIPTPGMAYAFCPKCMRYFVEVKGE